MGENSKIEWTTHTFNPWIGCARVSPACEHCYAEAMSTHYRWATWGVANAGGTRKVTSETNWRHPLAWNRTAHKMATRSRVFCASLADVCEDFSGDVLGDVTPETANLDSQRARLFRLIEPTEHLDWLLLTKRPENIARMIPLSWRAKMPANVWLGTTVEDQRRADERIPRLLENGSVVRFLSVEPQLGPIDLSPYIAAIDWVIAGGESGGAARETQVRWARSIRDQCAAAHVPFFFKQWGNHAQIASTERLVRLRTKNERLLDGRTWDEIPTPHRGGAVRPTAFERVLAGGSL
ncbi:MAG: phage Gp37/Gp68 family protein [Polyangiaceae bacterium]